MSLRITRVNELLKREISTQIHTNYQEEATYITITKVETSPDLRQARIFYSVIGDALQEREATKFLNKFKRHIRELVGDEIRLKYLPRFQFVPDYSVKKGIDMVNLMNEIEEDENTEDY